MKNTIAVLALSFFIFSACKKAENNNLNETETANRKAYSRFGKISDSTKLAIL
jgi:hypothetical protein